MASDPEVMWGRWQYETPQGGSGLEPATPVHLYDQPGGWLTMIEATYQPTAGKVYLLIFNQNAEPVANDKARHTYGPVDATTDGGMLVREPQEFSGFATQDGEFYGIPFKFQIWAALSSTPRIYTPLQNGDHWSVYARGQKALP